MSKSRARLLAELLNSAGRVKKDKSDLAGADSIIDLDTLPTITNAKLENSSISVAGHSVSLGGSVSLDTADISEHTDYPYFTNARARGAISVSGDLAYNSSTGVISFTERTDAEVRGLVSAGGNLSYNSTTGVFSYTTPTTIASLSNHDTDDLVEGTNLYYTNARARAAVSASTGSAGYTSSTGVFTIPSTSDHITEGSNQFFTNARARSAISVSGSLSYNSSTGVISYTQPTNISTFTNDSAYITSSANITGTSAGLSGTPNITVGTISSGAITSSGVVSATGLGINESSRLSPVHVTVTSSQTALTLQNTLGGSGANVGLDFITYNDISGYANPGARISAVDDGSYGANLIFYGKANAINGALSTIMTVKAKGDVEVNSGDLDIKSGDLELNGTARITNAGNATLGTISSGAITSSGNIGGASGHVSGKFAVKSTSVHGSYDFYNNGTSYFNGTTEVNAELKVSSSSAYITHLNYQDSGQNYISQATSGGLTQFRNSNGSLMEIAASGNVTIANDLTVSGNFSVLGTTTTLNTATLQVEDKNITLNYSTGDSSATANGAGITIQDAVNSSTDASMTWNATNDMFDFSHGIQPSWLYLEDQNGSVSSLFGIYAWDDELQFTKRNLSTRVHAGTLLSLDYSTDAATFSGNITLNKKINNSLGNLVDHDGSNNYIKGGGGGSNSLYLQAGHTFTTSHLTVGNTSSSILKSRHVDGKAAASTSYENLYLNYYAGNAVIVGRSDQNATLQVHGPIQQGTTTVIDTSRNITGQQVLVNNQLIVRNSNTNAALHFSTGDDFAGIGFNRNVATGAIYDSGTNAFQFHLQGGKLEVETYNGAGTTQADNAWNLDTSGNMSTKGTIIAGNNYSPTGSVIGSVRAYGSTNAYMGASDQAGRTAFFGVDTSGYAMFGSLTDHNTVIRANNSEKLRIQTNGVINIAANGVLAMNGTTVIDSSRALQNVTANASIINAGTFPLARMPANLASISSTSADSGLYFRGTTEKISGETYATAFYAYNQNDGFLFLNRDGSNNAKAVFHIGGYNNATSAGYSSEDTVITISRNDGAKANNLGTGLSASSYRSQIVKTTTATVFSDTQGKHEFDGNLEITEGKLIVKSSSNGFARIEGTDANHMIIMRGNRDSTSTGTDMTTYYQYGGTRANGKGHLFYTGGALASQSLKLGIHDDAIALHQPLYYSSNLVLDSNRNIFPYQIRGSGGDDTPAGTQFSNVIKAQGTNRTLYIDGHNGSVSTWYGIGNNPYAAIDVGEGLLDIWVNPSNGSWYNIADYTTSGLNITYGVLMIGGSTAIDTGRNFTGGSVTANALKLGSGNSNASIFRTGSDGSGFHFTTNAIYPADENGGVANGTEDLGGASNKFKDGFFSGNFMAGLYKVGGTTVIDGSRRLQNVSIDPYIGLTEGQIRGNNLQPTELMHQTPGDANVLADSKNFNVLLFKPPTLYKKASGSWSNLGAQTQVTDGKAAHAWGTNIINNTGDEYIFYWASDLGYSFMSQTTLMHSTNGHSMDIHIETAPSGTTATDAPTSGGWVTEVSATGVGSWPGSTTINKNVSVGGSYRPLYRIRIVPNWNSTYANNHISLGQIISKAGYGAASRLFNWDGNRNIEFNNGTTNISGNQELVINRGSRLRVDTNSIAASNTNSGLIFDGNYTNGQYRHRFRKQDLGAGIPLILDYAHNTANSYSEVIHFGGPSSAYNELSVRGDGAVDCTLLTVGRGANARPPNSSQLAIQSGKLTVHSNNNSYGQLQVGNPDASECGIGFLSGVDSGQMGSTNPTATNKWAIGLHVYGCGTTTWGVGNSVNTDVFRIRQNGDVEVDGHISIPSEVGTSTDPTFFIGNSSSETFNHSMHALAPNMTQGESNILIVGRNASTKNSGYLGYYWHAAGSNENFVTLGHWGQDHLFRVYGSGQLVGSAGITLTGTGISYFATNYSGNEDWENSPISIRERGLVSNNQTGDAYAPNINFHWASVVSRSLWMDSSGDFHIGEYSASGVPQRTGANLSGLNIEHLKISNSQIIDVNKNVYPESVQMLASNGEVGLSLNDGALHFRQVNDAYHKIWYYDGLAFATNSSHGHFRFYAESNTQRNNTTPGATLRFDIDAQNNTVTASGNITAYSDAKLKENVLTIENAVEKVKAVRGVTFTRNDQEDQTTRYMGVIAQEVEQVMPEVVSYNEENDVKTVSYGNMVGVLIEAIKEQSAQINAQQEQINQLTNLVNALKEKS